jgi:hypothetical protein
MHLLALPRLLPAQFITFNPVKTPVEGGYERQTACVLSAAQQRPHTVCRILTLTNRGLPRAVPSKGFVGPQGQLA